MTKILILVGVVIGIGVFLMRDLGGDVVVTDTTAPKTTTSEQPSAESATEDPVEKPPVAQLSGGQVLDLSGQGLTKVPEDVFAKTDLEGLDLSNNRLSGALQAEVRHLQSLRTLDLSGNEFTGVPAEIGQLKDLETLDLSDNNLTGLPYELGNLSNLKMLDLTGNDYAAADLAVIKSKLPASVVIKVD